VALDSLIQRHSHLCLMNSAAFSKSRVIGLSLLVANLAPRAARAEDSVRYKFQDYQETGGRIAVKVNGATVDKDLGTEMHLKVDGVIDAITGATPTGQPAPPEVIRCRSRN